MNDKEFSPTPAEFSPPRPEFSAPPREWAAPGNEISRDDTAPPPKSQHSAAGVAKKSVHSLLAQDLYKDLRTIQLHGVAPIPVPLLIHSPGESF